jgi:hypothetical protein
MVLESKIKIIIQTEFRIFRLDCWNPMIFQNNQFNLFFFCISALSFIVV